MEVLGIDIGGTGIKGAPVDTNSGAMLAPRFRVPTPSPSKPEAVAERVAEVARHFAWEGRIGVGFPAVVRGGVTLTAANIHKLDIKAKIPEFNIKLGRFAESNFYPTDFCYLAADMKMDQSDTIPHFIFLNEINSLKQFTRCKTELAYIAS